jgi:uncharacterized protein (DUF362 family)
VDVHMAVTPDFNVVDAVVALEGDGPNLPPGRPKPLGLILAGANPVSVDAVAASIMGISPGEIKHLVKAEGRGLGTADLEMIRVLGERITDVRSPFLLPRIKD